MQNNLCVFIKSPKSVYPGTLYLYIIRYLFVSRTIQEWFIFEPFYKAH